MVVKAVAAAGEDLENVTDAGALTGRGKVERLLNGHVGILIAVDEHDGRVGGRDVAHRTEGVKVIGLASRIVAGQRRGPKAGLACTPQEQRRS